MPENSDKHLLDEFERAERESVALLEAHAAQESDPAIRAELLKEIETLRNTTAKLRKEFEEIDKRHLELQTAAYNRYRQGLNVPGWLAALVIGGVICLFLYALVRVH